MSLAKAINRNRKEKDTKEVEGKGEGRKEEAVSSREGRRWRKGITGRGGGGRARGAIT